jgi:hypothetical protein
VLKQYKNAGSSFSAAFKKEAEMFLRKVENNSKY